MKEIGKKLLLGIICGIGEVIGQKIMEKLLSNKKFMQSFS